MVSLVDVLVSRGAELDAKDVLGSTPLHYAYAFRMGKAVEALRKYGAGEGGRNMVRRMKYDEGGDSESEDEYSDDEDEGFKGRLPRECAGLGKKIFPT